MAQYKFIHDRVQEAAYSLIPEASRAEAHLRIGRLLAARTSPQERDEIIFDIVNHLNRGVVLITSREERENLAELNLIAGKRAKASTAYASALKYFNTGAALLADDCWERRHGLIFALELARAESEFLTGELATADERLTTLASRAANNVERAAVACLHVGVSKEMPNFDLGIAAALDYLRYVGIDWSPHPTEDDVCREYERIGSQLVGRTVEDVVDSPLMIDRESLATIEVLTAVMFPAAITDQNLSCLTTFRAVSLSLEKGNCDASSLAYVMLARAAILRFRDYKAAFRFGQMSVELVEGHKLKRFEAGTYLVYAAMISPWMKHVRTSRASLRRAFDAANEIGDLTNANYANIALISNLLSAGDPLSEVQREAELALEFAEKTRFSGNADNVSLQLALIRTLCGLTPRFGCFDSDLIGETRFERHLAGNPSLATQECFYWIRKIQARYFVGDYTAAMEASTKAQKLLWISPGFIEESEYHFYSALSRAASCDSLAAGDRMQHLEALSEHRRQLEIWAQDCPDNFENRAALVEAEIARIESRELDAERLYETAIHSSRAYGFVNNEALAYERASAFYRSRGFEQIADAYLRSARACYLAWGAVGKVTRGESLAAPLTELRKLTTDEPNQESAPTRGDDIARIVKETIASLKNKSPENDHARRQHDEIVVVLTECKGRVGGADGAAARLSLSRTTLISRMKKLGINPYDFASTSVSDSRR